MSKPMPMHGGPKGMPGGPGMQPRKLDKKTLKRLLSYMKNYKGTLVLVTVCILLSSVAGAAASMFLQSLIDDYITPMIGQASPDFSGFIRALITMAAVYLIGTLSTLIYNRRMVTVAQGTLKTIRDEMFEKMQRLLAPVEQMCAGSEEFRDNCDQFGKHKRALGETWREKLAIDAQARALCARCSRSRWVSLSRPRLPSPPCFAVCSISASD